MCQCVKQYFSGAHKLVQSDALPDVTNNNLGSQSEGPQTVTKVWVLCHNMKVHLFNNMYSPQLCGSVA